MRLSKTKGTPWAVINTFTGRMECQRCGEVAEFNSLLPLPIDAVAVISKGFVSAHRRCKLTPEGAALADALDKMNAEWNRKKEEQKAREQGRADIKT